MSMASLSTPETGQGQLALNRALWALDASLTSRDSLLPYQCGRGERAPD
jgi:hypothetical protein